MIWAGTGHRPERLFINGYRGFNLDLLVRFLERELAQVTPSTKRVISGMALGFDQALAIAAIRMGIPVTAAVPCLDYEKHWNASQQKLYHRILNKVDQTVIVTEEAFQVSLLFRRNEWMVDHAEGVLGMWDHTQRGGTWRCLQYAFRQQKHAYQLWEPWILFRDGSDG